MEPQGVETWRIQAFAIAGSALFLFAIVQLIKRRHLREEYALLWLACGVLITVLSIWRRLLEILARFLGIAYAPAALFLVSLAAVLLILLHFSVILSTHTERLKRLAMEIALLRGEKSEQAARKATEKRSDPQ